MEGSSKAIPTVSEERSGSVGKTFGLEWVAPDLLRWLSQDAGQRRGDALTMVVIVNMGILLLDHYRTQDCSSMTFGLQDVATVREPIEHDRM